MAVEYCLEILLLDERWNKVEKFLPGRMLKLEKLVESVGCLARIAFPTRPHLVVNVLNSVTVGAICLDGKGSRDNVFTMKVRTYTTI
jgi:hypothetical protein